MRTALQALAAACILSFFASGEAFAQGVNRNGRWLTYDGQTNVYLVGFDTQELAADPSIDYIAALNTMQQNRINKVRIWLYCYFGESFLHPWTFNATTRTFNLDQWNSAYWTRLRAFVQAAQARDIVVEVSVFAPNNLDSSAGWNGAIGGIPMANAWNKVFNTSGAFTANANGHFMPQFFDLNYQEAVGLETRRLRDVQQALLDKAVAEIGSFDNVIFEACNEFPLKIASIGDAGVRSWHHTWLDRLNSTTPRLVTCHAQQGWGANTTGIDHCWSRASVDILNFHFYTYGPGTISNLLLGAQTRGKVLSNNESGNYRVATAAQGGLDGNTRFAWAMLLSGGYFGMYEDDSSLIGDASWNAAAQRLRALRDIAEAVEFAKMSPVDTAGNDYDVLATAGPTSTNWQVLAKPGERYLAYFWNAAGTATATAAQLTVPAGTYTYRWYDVRNGAQRATGTVTSNGSVSIAPPATTQWSPAAGLALTLIGSGTPPGGGTLTCTPSLSPATKNLSTEGTLDWAHWGHATAASFDHKSGVTQQISNYTQIGGRAPIRFDDAQIAYSWSGGTPTASATNSTTGLAVVRVGNGYQITVPASATARTLRLYIGVWNGRGQLTAALSDGSAAACGDSSISSGAAGTDRFYTIRFAAASASQTLTVRWTVLEDNGGGVTLQAATLTP
ncbi:MAG TPA: hypothetical protein VF017_16855 [Thermoanaerobaculia bacterium]|nr:hypothetical protein [Thermoanaerobaculia bacterium]